MKQKTLREKLDAVYETLPAMDSKKCASKCILSKVCNFDSCTVTACGSREKHNINRYIKENKLDLPFIKERTNLDNSDTYYLPAVLDDMENPVCSYVTDQGCAVYPVRPAICRIYGKVTKMKCPHFPEEATGDDLNLEPQLKEVGIYPN